MESLHKYLKEKFESLGFEYNNWQKHWDEVSQYIVPTKDNIYGLDYTQGQEKNWKLYDSTSIHANDLLASALHSMLTNPSLKFFGMTTGIPELDRNDNVRLYLQKCVDVIHEVLNNSNFHSEVHELYVDLGSFGTAPMFINEDDSKYVNFMSKPIYEFRIDENSKGVIDTVFRTYKYSARQMLQDFSDTIKNEQFLRELENSKKDSKPCFEIIHCVYPREDAYENSKKYGKGSLMSSPIASVHMMKSASTVDILKESGYWEMPYVVPRWSKTSSEKYGRSPGMKALPDIRMLNAMQKTVIQGAQFTVRPALQVADDGSYRPIKMVPGGISYTRPGSEIKPIVTNARPDIGLDMIKSLQDRVYQDYFIDQLQLRSGPQMTAEEVRTRSNEQLRMFGPVLGRQQNEFLSPMIDRVFAILGRRGKLPQTPNELAKYAGAPLKVTYSSTIARIQKSAESENLIRTINLMAPIVQSDPSIMDNIDGDAAFRMIADQQGVPQEMLTKKKDVEMIRKQRAEAQAKVAEQQSAQADAQTMNTMAGAMQ